MINGAVYQDGKVVLRYYQPTPKYIQIGNKEYVCDVRHGVSILLVEENEAQSLLDFLGGCCGGQRKVFSLANQESVNVWKTGDR